LRRAYSEAQPRAAFGDGTEDPGIAAHGL